MNILANVAGAALTPEQLREKYPLTYPDLASWQRHVAGLETPEQLSHAGFILKSEAYRMPKHHPFMGEPEYDVAWQALFDQARVIGVKWDKTRKRFV